MPKDDYAMNQPAPPPVQRAAPHDPYRLTSLEQILAIFGGGEFLGEVMQGHQELQQSLLDYKEEHGAKGAKGSMTIKVSYDLGKSGDVAMGAEVEFKTPKKPPTSAAAFIDENGQLTLYSPMMKRMHEPVRDLDHDPVTGEVRDLD